MDHRAGRYITHLSREASYRSFIPSPLPPDPPLSMSADMVELLEKARAQLALLEGLASQPPYGDPFVFLSVRKEALMSSQIEGIGATLEDIFDPLVDEHANRDIEDVVNNIKAIEYAVAQRATLPLCNRLIRNAHAVLMQGTRGANQSPGEFRFSQNWIGGAGSTLQTARYIPPAVVDMEEAMADLEQYFHTRDGLDVLIRAALIHYQFESIHPFLDGNGRIGRLLITLHLMEEGVLTTPALSISSFLKQHQAEYYDRMSEVRSTGNYEQWVKFFLQAVYESASDAIAAIEELTALLDTHVHLIAGMGCASGTTMRLFSYLETHPIIDIESTASSLEMAFNTAEGAIERLIQAGILHQATTTRRGRTFVYTDYLGLLRKGTE